MSATTCDYDQSGLPTSRLDWTIGKERKGCRNNISPRQPDRWTKQDFATSANCPISQDGDEVPA